MEMHPAFPQMRLSAAPVFTNFTVDSDSCNIQLQYSAATFSQAATCTPVEQSGPCITKGVAAPRAPT